MFDIFKRKEETKNEQFIFKAENYKTISIEQAKFNNTFALTDTVHLTIQEYKQSNINAGIILGMPSDLSNYFEHSFKCAKQFFNDEFYVINPVLFTDKSSANTATYLLPQFLTMAVIDRNMPLEGENYACSSLRVIWWQNTLGSPESEILEQIKEIVWKKPYANSWDF